MTMQPAFPAFLLVVSLSFSPTLAQDAPADAGERIEEERKFMRMTQPAEEPDACEPDDPPADLAETTYVRNGYFWMRSILAMERWEVTGSCECFLDDVPWAEAVEAARSRFVVSSDPLRPFDVGRMREAAKELVARRAQVCGD
jgi:hypothetical protein